MWGKMAKSILLIAVLSLIYGGPSTAGSNKVEKEVEKEKIAVKLAREVVKVGYELVTT